MVKEIFYCVVLLFHHSFCVFCNKKIGIENVKAFPDSSFSHSHNYLTPPQTARMKTGNSVWLASGTTLSWVQIDLSKFLNMKN